MNLCVALDCQSGNNFDIVKKLSELDDMWYKVSLRNFLRDGKNLLRAIKFSNPTNKIFLDLNLFGDSNAVSAAVEEVLKLKVDMFTIHSSVGYKSMKRIGRMLSLLDFKTRPKAIVTTALTTMSKEEHYKIYGKEIIESAVAIAYDSWLCKLDGVICSVWEAKYIRDKIFREGYDYIPFEIVCPGIREGFNSTDNHYRYSDIFDANAAGATMVVVGRPIISSKDPKIETEGFLDKINLEAKCNMKKEKHSSC